MRTIRKYQRKTTSSRAGKRVRKEEPWESNFGSVNQVITSAIFLDPSINETGWAIFHYGETTSGVIKTHGGSIEERLYSLRIQLVAILDEHNPALAVIEYPPSFTYSRSVRIDTGKSMNLESLIKLSCATGIVISSCQAKCEKIEVILASWKGDQINKNYSMLVTGKNNHNEADACLMRLWYLGRNQPVKEPRGGKVISKIAPDAAEVTVAN